MHQIYKYLYTVSNENATHKSCTMTHATMNNARAANVNVKGSHHHMHSSLWQALVDVSVYDLHAIKPCCVDP
jgi:hypothetical protein